MMCILNKKTNAFTLIEILVSVMVIALFATVTFNISSKNKHLYDFLDSRMTRFLPMSIVFNSNLQTDSDVTLMDLLSPRYPNIKNDELRQILKNIKYKFREKNTEVGLLFALNTISVSDEKSTNQVYSFRILDIGLKEDIDF